MRAVAGETEGFHVRHGLHNLHRETRGCFLCLFELDALDDASCRNLILFRLDKEDLGQINSFLVGQKRNAYAVHQWVQNWGRLVILEAVPIHYEL